MVCAGRELQRVLDHVDERPLHLCRVGPDRWEVGRYLDADAVAVAQVVERELGQRIGRPDGLRGSGRPCLKARQIEHVLDVSLEPLELVSNRFQKLRPLCAVQRDRLALKPVEGGLDRCERRAQVMRNGLDHRSLDRVRSSQGLRLERFPLEALALVRDRNERRDRLFESHGRRVFRMLDPFDQVTQVAALQEAGGEVGEQGRVALAPLGLCGSPPHSRRELARHHRGREIDEKSRPVARLVQRERVHRRQEEPVEDE